MPWDKAPVSLFMTMLWKEGFMYAHQEPVRKGIVEDPCHSKMTCHGASEGTKTGVWEMG